jgi:hypothetical protein
LLGLCTAVKAEARHTAQCQDSCEKINHSRTFSQRKLCIQVAKLVKEAKQVKETRKK